MVGHLCRWDLGLALNLSQVIEVIHNSNVSETHPLDDGLCAVVRPAAEVEAVSLHVATAIPWHLGSARATKESPVPITSRP